MIGPKRPPNPPGQNEASVPGRTARVSPTLVAVSAEGFLTRLGFGMVGFATPLFALSLGMGVAEVGFLFALSTTVTVLIKPAMGWAADRFGKKRTLVAAVALRCLVGGLLIVATLPWHLYVIRILHGTMTAARTPSASALIAEHGNKRKMASAFAWYTTARDLGRSLGYAAAGLLIEATGNYRIVFLIAFLTSCSALATVLRYVRENSAAGEEPRIQTIHSPATERPRALYRGLLRYAGFGLMVAGSAEMMRGLFPIIATEFAHLTEGQAGLVVSASSIAVLVGGPLFGWLSDRGHRKLALSARSVANTFSSVMYILFPSFAGFLVARVVDDTGKAAFRPSWGAVLADVSDVDPSRRASTMAFVDTATNLGQALGPLAAGLLMAGFGVPVMLGVRAGLSLATEIQALLLFRRREVTHTPEEPVPCPRHLGT